MVQVWNSLSDHECLALRDVQVLVRVGVHEVERQAPQSSTGIADRSPARHSLTASITTASTPT